MIAYILIESYLFLGLSVLGAAYNVSSTSEHCSDLFDFTGDAGLEAPTKVSNATYVPANTTSGIPAYCSILAHVETSGGDTRYLAYLPADGSDWVGTFVAHGCGGSCGSLGLDYAYGYGSFGNGYGRDAVAMGFMIIQNDLGHDSTLTNDTSSSWNAFRNNRTNENNFAFLSTHVTTVSGKALAEFYYGVYPKRSIFRGGSTGGRQGLISAARYPHDFDGIITGYGALNETGIGAIQYPYLAQVSQYGNGTQILSSADLYSLNAGALAVCDENDGLVDGVIDNSYACDFDPVTILCANKTLTTTHGCLDSMSKVAAARKMYGWPSNSYSNQLVYARYPPGSELSWALFTTAAGANFASSFTINAAFQQDLVNWTLDQYDWDVYPYATAYMEDIYSTDFTNLGVFRAKGGKILHYQGWADGSVAAGWNVEVYQKTIDTIGYNTTTDFHRLFMLPGAAHIDINQNVDGIVGWRADYYGMLNAWLDTGVAPETLVVEHWNYTTGAVIDTR
ncbi:feruloyl esterase b [Seiridium cupressi]